MAELPVKAQAAVTAIRARAAAKVAAIESEQQVNSILSVGSAAIVGAIEQGSGKTEIDTGMFTVSLPTLVGVVAVGAGALMESPKLVAIGIGPLSVSAYMAAKSVTSNLSE